MLAAEHGGLPNGKVGGIGDVIEQLPPVLVDAGLSVEVLLPSYGVYQRNERAEQRSIAEVSFGGSIQTVALYELPKTGGAGCWVIDHPLFAAPAGQIYHHDPSDQPFATDANIYALFCAAAVEFVACGALPTVDVIHLHDWHAATFAVLAQERAELKKIKLVYTIHNLALQGIRPLEGHPSSFASWFPEFDLLRPYLKDPTFSDCYNPTGAAISLADKVHLVSPNYAVEVLEANDESLGRHGGEGLETVLRRRADEGDLIGILNGCVYADEVSSVLQDADAIASQRLRLEQRIRQTTALWLGQNDALRSSDFLAREALEALRDSLPGCFLLTSVGRVTHQKVGLLLHKSANEKDTLLDALLKELGEHGVFIMLGSGDSDLERQLVSHAARHSNFIFMRGYSDSLAESLYASGDLFLMPSLYEPCGISQLLAMREGQPCLVQAVGGLKDTVEDNVEGFVFDGDDLADKVLNCELALKRALRLRANVESYREMRNRARAKRVTWEQAASRYIEELYS